MSCFSVVLFACTCPQVNGLNGKFAGFATMDSLLNHTFLIKVTSKSTKGVTVQIQTDYKNSTKLTELFIVNMNPGFTCSHSTDNFYIGQQYLVVFESDGNLGRENSLSTCFESFINVSGDQVKAQVSDRKKIRLKTWAIEELEEELSLKIKN